ncbi:MAG: hypothetical protein HY881_18910 [Deltaproteobacteria bacterium]|nr:hypothetical protein [Deltaproteobacteria bacterium]
MPPNQWLSGFWVSFFLGGADQINSFKYQDKRSISGLFIALKATFRGQNDSYKVLEHQQVDADPRLLFSPSQDQT